ncbi:MAG: pitrilysin family protein [Acidobacteria bacterium]|nr:pitrilysin family protein [Acidobacteriota bacterium]
MTLLSKSVVRRRTRAIGGAPQQFLALVVALVVNTVLAEAQALPPGVERGASIAGITEYTFPNGLRVLLLPDPSSSTVTVNATYLVGSRHEGYGETGMAHLLEHLLFITSTNGVDIKQELENHGARWNGTTWYDRTNYYETVNASDANLRWALELEAERMQHMRIDQEVLDTEMTVVRNEFERGENSVTGVLEERVFSTAYLWHNYGKSTIGSRSDIEAVTAEKLADFYRRYYRPDNAVLIVAGRMDPSNTLAMIAETLGAIPSPDVPVEPTYTLEPPQDGERTVHLRRVGSGQNLMIAYHTPAMAHPDAAALEVLSGILAGAGTGRLELALEDTGKALSVSAALYELHDPGVMLVSANLNAEQSIEEVQSILLSTLDDLARDGPTADEVERARTRILQRMDRMIADSRRFAMSLTESAAAGDWRLLFTNYEGIRQVTREDVQGVAERYLKASNRTVGTFIADPDIERVAIPAALGIDALLAAYTPNITVEVGEALDPSPASLESRIERSKLESGLRLALLPKETRGGRVQASITFRYGNESTLVGRDAAADLASALVLRGTRSKSRQQLQNEMQELNATIDVFGGLARVTASISTTSENLIPAMRLATEILREPAFSEADFDQIRRQRIARLERSLTEPEALVAETLQRHLSPYPRTDVRYVPTMSEEIDRLRAVSLDDVIRFHQDFYAADEGEVVVVGQFDARAVEAAADDLLGSWISGRPYGRIVSNYIDVERINTDIETPDKENAQLSAGLRLRMTDSDADYAAMVMANYMFGGGIKARLPDRIRNREGLSYSVGSRFSAPAEGDAAVFSASAIANPLNISSVEASFRDELTRTLRDGFAADELAAAQQALLDERIGSRSSDAGVLNLISAREQWGRTLAWDEELDRRLAALTVDDVNTAFRRHVDAEAVSVVKGGDFRETRAPQ